MEKTPPKKGIGQLFFIVGGDDHNRALTRLYGLACFIDMKGHSVEFLQQIVWKFDISFVNLINEQDDFFVALKGLPNFAFLDIV